MSHESHEEGTPILHSKYHLDIDATGPYLVYGKLPIRLQVIMPDEEGYPWTYRSGRKDYHTGEDCIALCRCGYSKDKPYCDGMHDNVDWDPELTASRRPLLDDAQVIEGQTLNLTDNESYCAYARFCDAKDRTWNMTLKSDDPQMREWAIRTANHCPAGRLKQWDKETGKPFEPDLKPEIGIVEDPSIKASAGLWVMGGIPIRTPDGFQYQVRNRVMLCRCGASSNKPYCDGTHASFLFKDGLRHDLSDEEI